MAAEDLRRQCSILDDTYRNNPDGLYTHRAVWPPSIMFGDGGDNFLLKVIHPVSSVNKFYLVSIEQWASVPTRVGSRGAFIPVVQVAELEDSYPASLAATATSALELLPIVRDLV